jgi:hypothetical protein
MTATTTAPAREKHALLRHRLRIDGGGVVPIGGGFLVLVLAITAVVSLFGEVTTSGWEIGTQVIRWFVGAIGVYLSAVYLPMYVTHGRTRREVLAQHGPFAAIYVVLVAILVTVGFALERLVYRLAGWAQAVGNDHLFTAPDQYLLIFAEHAIVLLVWISAGALLGAAFYRGTALGLLLVPVGLAAVGATELVAGPANIGPLPPPLVEAVGYLPRGAGLLGATATSLVWTALLGVGTWLLLRDVPIRPEPS